MSKPIRVGITHGDYNGVGYEVIFKALDDERITELFTPVVYCDAGLARHAMEEFRIENMPETHLAADAKNIRDGRVNLIDLGLESPRLDPGHPDSQSGAAAVAALEKAVTDVLAGDIDLLVTAPICKEAVQSDSFRFPGHTEYLNSRAGKEHHSQMILFADHLRVALVTTHLPIAEVSRAITREAVADTVRRFSATLRRDFGIERPKIAVLGLNPHCGDGGVLGNEEKDRISPAIKEVSEEGVMAFGPYPADAFFANPSLSGAFDGVVAMYHDQGLAPFKALARTRGVNFTAGLPFVRTSPDHGTGNDIAWKGTADCESMRQAIYEGIDILRGRRRHDEASANPLPRASRSERPEKPERGEKAERPDKSDRKDRKQDKEKADKGVNSKETTQES